MGGFKNLPVVDVEVISSLVSSDVNIHDSSGASLGSNSGKLLIDGSGVTQPISAVSLPLPLGASTSALQTAGNASLASIDSKLTAPLSVSGPLTDTQLRASAVPISGIVTANIGTISSIATESTLSALNLKIPSGLTVSSMRLLVDGSGVTQPISGTIAVSNFPASQPVTGPLTDVQLRASSVPVSGTFFQVTQPVSIAATVAISASSLPLPTGAATSALQTTGNTSLASIDSKLTSPISANIFGLDWGSVSRRIRTSERGADFIDGIYDATLNTIPSKVGIVVQSRNFGFAGETAQVQRPTGSRGTVDVSHLSVDVALHDSNGNALSDTNALIVRVAERPTYSAAILGLATAMVSTDIFVITGSATKVIKIESITVSATRSTSSNTDIVLLVRSTDNSGGSFTTVTAVPHDSNNAAATAVVRAYTANPTTGTLVGNLRTEKTFFNSAGAGPSDRIEWTFRSEVNQRLVLRGTSQILALNLNGQTITTPSFDIFISWSEE